MAARRTSANKSIDALLEHTLQRPAPAHPPTLPKAKPIGLRFKEWASSQVAVYRAGLVVVYIAMMYFGASAYVAGIPTFDITTPNGWTPIWSAVVVLGGLIAAVGALKAGTEPVTHQIHIFNRIELVGAVMLFLTLGTYAALLLILGYGYGDAGRASVGAGFVALGVHPTIRMIWLIWRPTLSKTAQHHTIATGPVLLLPDGYKLVKIEGSEASADHRPGNEGA